MPFYQWNSKLSRWTDYQYSDTYNTKDNIKSVTLNVLFNEHNGNSYKSNIIFSKERYEHILNELSKSGADIITLNEVTKMFLRMIEECEWVRQNYFISEISLVNDEISCVYPFGNLIITKLPPSDCQIIKVHTLPRFIVTGIFNIKNKDDKMIKFSVSSGHLISRVENFKKRECQMDNLVLNLSYLNTDVNIIQGDMNYHSESELKPIGYCDAWKQLYDIKENPGYTFDSKINHMHQEMWYGFENRRMRLDRVFMSNKNTLKVAKMKVIFNEPVYENNDCYVHKKWYEKILSFVTDTSKNKETYLFSSDHFGLETVFELC